MQSKIDNFQKILINDACSNVPNALRHKKRDIVSLPYVEDFPTNVTIQGPRIDSYQYFTDTFEGNTYCAKLLTITPYPNILNVPLQELGNAVWINTTNKWNNNNNTYTYTTSKWIIMASSAERKNKGKAHAQGYPQDNRLLVGKPFVMHEGASSGVKPSGSTSL